MVEMVHDRIAAGETPVVSTAAVLRCGKQMEKLPHYNFPGESLSKTLEEAMDLSRDRNEMNDEILKMEAVGSSEPLVTIYQITRRHIPEYRNLK
jgi:hypothetical protein